MFAGCLTKDKMSELTSECSSRLKPVHIDVSDESSVAEALAAVEKCLPKGKGQLSNLHTFAYQELMMWI